MGGRGPEPYDTMFGSCCKPMDLDSSELQENPMCNLLWIGAFPFHSDDVEPAPKAGEPEKLAGFAPRGFAPTCPGFHVRSSHSHVANHWADQEIRLPSYDHDVNHGANQENRRFDKWVVDNIHETVSDNISTPPKLPPPPGTLDHEDLCRRLRQVRRLRGESEGELCIPREQKAKMMKMTFWPSLQKRDVKFEVNFRSRPLGMQFNVGTVPCVVRSTVIGSAAGRIGVKKGMVIASIDDEDVTKVSYDEFYAIISEKSSVLPYLPPNVATKLEF